MTSTNDGKDVKSNQTSGHKGKSYYIDLYKSLEKHLSEECELRERTQHLCEAWRRVHSLCQHSAPTTHPHYLAWLQRHTANTLLQSEWQSENDEHTRLEDAINTCIADGNAAAANRNGVSPAWESQLLQRGEWFKSILGNPWGHPVLKVLCDPRGKPPTDEEILEWLKEERGVMFVTRLRHLAASRKCHEIALSLASAVMDRARASEILVPDADQADDQEPSRPEGSQPTFKDVLRTEAGFTVDVWELVTDLELVLLHKRDEHAQCIALAKKIPLRSGYQLVERLRSRPEVSPREKKLWKNAGEVATLVAQVLMARCMVVPWCVGVVLRALYCCARSLVRLVPCARLPAAARALAAPAATARHLHTLAAAVHTQLHAQNAQDMNSFVCELYVRAITAGMNELEKLKIKTEKESEARVMEQTLATWFTSLGSLLQASARIQCECALTAFSVHPSPAMYDKIKLAPPLPNILVENQEPKEESKSEFGSWANDSRGQTNLVKTSETLKLKQTQQHTNVMSTAIFAEGEAIGLSAELCQDLTVCLSGPRVKTLSWDMDRDILLDNCQKYMARTHGGTRALTTELKYLNLDPSQYQHLPEEEDDENDVYYGIEKGYEHLVELQEEVGWEDPFETETAYSSCMEDDMPLRRKKKTKRLPLYSDDESDPLSTLVDANQGEKKKERPHSKERSKESKKKPKDPEKEKEKKDNKEKKKRERKKKPKEPPVSKPGSLASLIGVKIARADEIAVTDSDYDSQGKSSLASEGNDPNVIFDGLFTMDHKSPDKVDPLSDKTLNNELGSTNGVAAVNAIAAAAANKPKRKPSVNKRKPKANANLSTDGKPPMQPVKNTNILKFDPKPRPSAVGVVSDQVKRSITKLLQFRRNQNAGLLHKNAPRTDPKPVNAIYKPEFPEQPFVSPKSVVVPEIPKSYINKATLDKLSISRSPSVSNFGKPNEFMGPPPLGRFDNSSQNTVNDVVRSPSTNSAVNMSSPVNYKDIGNVQNCYQNTNMSHLPQASRSIVNDHSRAQPKNISMSLTRVEKSRAQVSEHEKSYEKFLRELKTSINAGTGSNPSPSPTSPVGPIGVAIKKDCKPTILRSPLMPSSSTSDLSTTQCAKQLPQKKVENAPNTFSRLSYMHKNKQSDMKQKQTLETQANRQDELNKQAMASLDLSRSISEFKNTKIKYIQTKGETVIKRVDNPLNLSCDNAVRKAEKSPPLNRNHPVISSMLQSRNIPQSPVSRNNHVTTTKVTSPPGTSYLSEKDQNDLLLLLQQQNRINAARTVPRVVNVSPNVPINMTTTSNKPASTNVQSKPIITQGQLNNTLQKFESPRGKIDQFEAKPDTVINFSKSATQKQERVKKTATTKPKPNGRKERNKSTHLESNTLDWESVMNAIRAQKTPSRGPSALELTLNKDSTDNSLRNQRIVRTSSVGQLDKIEAAVDAVIKQSNNVKPSTSLDMPILTTEDEVKTQNNTQIGIQNKPVEIKKAVKNATPKRVSGALDKKQTIKNKFAVSVSNNTDADPFIHGRDDDYNLSDLDDLLDDELRRELGELSSDEDAYRIPQAEKGVKITVSKSNTTSKPGNSLKEKIPNATVSSSDQLRPKTDMPVLNCQYPKSIKTSTIRSQTNKKQKLPVQTSLLNQSINKAPCNESVNKNIVYKEKPVQQVTNLSAQHQNSVTHTFVTKNAAKEKVANPSLQYKYLNTVHSNASAEKDILNTSTAVNQTPAPSLQDQYLGTSNTNVNNKVYVVENEPVIQVAVPTANLIVFGSEMYYNPNIQAQLGPNLCTMNQTYVQQTAPNIALYQTANFAAPVAQQPSFVAPVATPLILDDAINVPVTTSTPVTTHESLHEAAKQPYVTVTPPNQCVEEPQMVKSNQPIVIKECPVTRPTEEPLIDTTSKVHNTATIDINSNKNSELKASLDVQENHKHEGSKLPRSRAVSTEEVLRDILNEQEKDQTITNNVIINSVVKNLMNDRRETRSMKDTERLKRKRLAILNREVIQKSVHPPIALSYSPIFISPTDICEKKREVPIDSNKEVISQEIISVLGDDESTDVEQKLADAIDIIAHEVNETPLLKNDNTEKQPTDENSEEKTSTVQCRRILLRSSNKNLPKISNSANEQNPVGRKTKVRLKTVNAIPEIDTANLVEDTNKNVKPQYGTFTLKTIAKKNSKRKAVGSKNKKPSSEPTNDCPQVLEETAESIIDELCKNVTEPLISESFDIEEALLGAKIPNTSVADSLSISLAPPESVANEKSNVSAKKTNKVTILENKKITLRRKRKSVKVVDNSSDNKNDDNKIEQEENKSVIIENNCLNKVIVTQRRQSSRNKSLLQKSATKPEQPNDIINNVTDKKLSSKLEGFKDEMKANADAKNIVVPSEKIMDIMSKISKKDRPVQPVENIPNGTFQNVFESAAITSNNLQKPPKITNISKTIADLIDQINKGDVLEDNKANNKNDTVESSSIIAEKETVAMPASKTDAKMPVLDSNGSKNVEDNTSLSIAKNSIPQSYKDSIIIEEIPNDREADNVSKLLRVKLPNGKVYKASVYGKMHTSFDSLFDDPSIRAMLMSNFNEQMKYTLNIKQISIPNKENPDKPVDARIQEIQVKSSSMKPAVIETINLLSDDEESDDNCSFKTKCGVYKTTLKDKDVIAKHQAKFDQGCSVPLKRVVIPEKEVSPIDVLQTCDVIEIDEDSDTDNLNETLPPVALDKTLLPVALDVSLPTVALEVKNETNEQTKQSAAEVIEIIDESSNDSIDLLKSCPNLPVALIADVPMKSSVNEAESDNINNPQVSMENNIVNYDLQAEHNDKSQSEEALLCKESFKESLDCYVSLSKCDDLVEKYKNIDVSNCVDTAEDLDTSFDTSDAEMSSNASVSILNDFPLHPDKNHEELTEDGRSSPVIGIFEVIAALHRRCEVEKEIKMADAKCESEWLVTKRHLRNEHEFIKSQMVNPSKSYIEEYSENGRSSPVMGIFDVIASLGARYIAEKERKLSCYEKSNCKCEWLSTKRQLRQDYNVIVMKVNENNGKKKFQQFDDSSSKKQAVSAISTPSLVSIMSLFFQKSNLLDHLKPLTKIANKQRVKRRKSSISNLKRKMHVLPDNAIANKMSKNDPTQNEKFVHCNDSNDMDILRVSDKCVDKKSGIQNNPECSIDPELASYESEEITESDEVMQGLPTMSDIATTAKGDNEDNVSFNNIENINVGFGSCESDQNLNRMDCEESHDDMNEDYVECSKIAESSNSLELVPSESLPQLEDKMTTGGVIVKSSQNHQFEGSNDLGDVQNNNCLSDNSLTLEERHVVESLSCQNQQVCDVINAEDLQNDNNIAFNITNTFEMVSKENEVEEESTAQDMTTKDVKVKQDIVFSKDPQFDDTDDMKDVAKEADVEPINEVKMATEKVADGQAFAQDDIVSNEDQQVSFTDCVRNDYSVVTLDSNEAQLKDDTRIDDICERHTENDIDSIPSQDVQNKDTIELHIETKMSLKVDEAEKNALETPTTSQNQQLDKTTTTEDLQNAEISTESCADVESQVKQTLEEVEDKQIEETVTSLSQYYKLNSTSGMENVQSDIDMSSFASKSYRSQIEEKVAEFVDELEANMESNQNEVNGATVMDVIKVASTFINTTSESVQSKVEDKYVTEVVSKQGIVEADVISIQNDQISFPTEVLDTLIESSLSSVTNSKSDVQLQFDENRTKEYKEIVDAKKSRQAQQIIDTSDVVGVQCVNIITSDSDSEIEKVDGCQQVSETTMVTDENNKRQDIGKTEVVINPSQHSDQIMFMESLQKHSKPSKNNSDETTITDLVEVRPDNSQNKSIAETTTEGQIDAVVTGGLENEGAQAEHVINVKGSTSATTCVEILAREKETNEIPIVEENSGSDGDDETITIIEVEDLNSQNRVNMHEEILVDREEQESLLQDTNFKQIVVDTANENIEPDHCDSTTNFESKSDVTVPDSTSGPKNDHIIGDSCIALEVTYGDTTSHDNDDIELPVGEISSDNVDDQTCEELIEEEQRINDNYPKHSIAKHTVPDHEYTYLRQVSDGVATETEGKIDDANVAEQDAVVHENDSRDCLLRGIEFQDPDVGTLYVLYPIEDCGSDSATMNDSCDDTPETLEDIEDEVANNSSGSLSDDEALQVNVPKITYSKQLEDDLKPKKNLKRKIDYTDSKFTAKKYRKGKNIDYPKITAAAMTEQGYAKEYKRVFDYSSSLKFSYSQPFHKDYLDVNETIKDWPIKGPCLAQPELAADSEFHIFTDTETNPNYEPIPMEQSLGEEINQDYSEISEPSSDINETNFNMGFGEGSGRVIQNLEDVGDISKVSAATLSDVKHPQPFLLSEHCEGEGNNENATNDQLQNIQRYLTYIKLREKVKSFFHKSTIELKCDSLDQKKKDLLSNENLDSTTFPFDLYIGDFIEPPPFEPIVQVVQVGQLPVSAAAQNPVTCDPRVTQVSDASPSQCSVDNSPQDDSSTPIKTEYTELTTADFTLPLVQEYAHHNETMSMSHENPNVPMSGENIPIETEIKSVVKIELEELEEKEEPPDLPENTDTESMAVNHNNDYSYEVNTPASELNMPEIKYETDDPPPTPYGENNATAPLEQNNMQMMFNSTEEDRKDTPPADFPQERQNGAPEKTDQIAHAMNAAGITTTSETIANNRAQALVNMINQKIRQGSGGGNTQATANSYSKTTSINAMALQQALAQILPPPLNQTNATDNNQQTSNTPQVLHIVQGKNASGSQITLVDNSQQSVISGTNATPVLHIVQNKSATPTANGAPGSQNNSFSGLSLVDAGLQQGGNQLLHIVNTGSQKNNNTGQLLKRVNLLTNLTNVQGSNEQKMVQFVCKSADGKSIQLNAPHQRSMVLRLQPIETPAPAAQAKPAENQDPNQSPSAANNKDAASQQEIKSRSVYEENYAKFIQNSGTKPAAAAEKSTSLPKFNQAFGKPVFQDGTQKSNDMNSNSMPSVNTSTENNECPPNENAINLEHIGQISSPPLLLRKSPAQTSQAQTNLVQQIKQTIAPMNIQTMHGGVIYTRQIPVNIGGGQTINLITVPSTELIDESGQKQQSTNQGEIEPSIIKIVPQSQSTNNSEMTEDGNANMATSNENNQNPQPQPQPVLTQMRIKLPMLSKTPQMVGGARVVRPSFFQIQRNVIGGANQPVYQQLVLTAAPPLGQQTIRLPTANRTQIKVPTESQSSTESMSSSTLEQLREFDMVLEQVKERSTVQPNSANTFTKLHTPSSDTTDNAVSAPSTPSEQTQVLYSIGNNQQLNVAYVNRKATVTTPTTANFVRSPDSSGVADSPTSSTHVRMSHAAASEGSSNEVASTHPKPAKVGSKSKSRPKSSSHTHSALAKINPIPAKTSTQKPLEDEQTTQRILYILAEYKEQVENSPDKDKPAPRRRSNPPSNPGSSKRKKSSSGSRRICGRDMSPVHGDETCRTMGSEDSSCGTSQGDCNENCLDSHSPQDSPRKIVRKLTYEPENAVQQPRPQPQRNVIVADGQTITVARGTAGKPATAVLMPANYILPVSMVKGGQQIAIVTNRGPKLLTVGGGEGGATNALLLQRLIGPGGLKPVLARPGVRHVRLPTAALHNLQAFNLATATTVQPPDSTASPAPAPTPPELVETRAASSPWTNRESEDVKPERGSSPEGSEPWNLPSSADPHDYTYEETVRADNMDRTVLDPIPDRYSPDMEAQRIFDKMFDVDSKKSYITDSPRCGYDIDASECDDKAYQVVHKKDGTAQRHHRLTHVSAAALRHKYAILEHELRLQKSLSEECEDLGVDSPSASELFPEAELLFAASPAHDHTQDHGQQSHTPQPTILNQSGIPQPDMDDQIATDQLLPREDIDRQQLELGLEDVGIVSVGAHGMHAIALDHEEFARAHPNTTFHTDEPTDDEPVPPFAIAGLKGRHITSTIFHSNRAPATVLMTAPQTTVISQASAEPVQNVKYADIDNMINSLPSTHNNINLSSVLVKDDGLTRFDNILNDSRELHLTNTASAIVHSTGNATQVIRRVCYDDKRDRDASFLMDEPDAIIAGDDAKMIAEDSSRDATLESMADVDDDRSSPERHAELFWESNSASERSESRRPLDFSSDSDKCCKSPSYDETNSTDSSGVGTHMRLDSVIKDARGIERSGSADGSSADDTHPPLRTYPPKRLYHPLDGDMERSLTGKTRAGERSPDSLEVRRRASGRGVVKRGCHCCNGSPAPPRPKKSRQRKPTMDFTTN